MHFKTEVLTFGSHPVNFTELANNILRNDQDYEEGLVICADTNGYWLESDGERFHHPLLMSKISKIILTKIS